MNGETPHPEMPLIAMMIILSIGFAIGGIVTWWMNGRKQAKQALTNAVRRTVDDATIQEIAEARDAQIWRRLREMANTEPGRLLYLSMLMPDGMSDMVVVSTRPEQVASFQAKSRSPSTNGGEPKINFLLQGWGHVIFDDTGVAANERLQMAVLHQLARMAIESQTKLLPDIKTETLTRLVPQEMRAASASQVASFKTMFGSQAITRTMVHKALAVATNPQPEEGKATIRDESPAPPEAPSVRPRHDVLPPVGANGAPKRKP